jgi:hypothetical protein
LPTAKPAERSHAPEIVMLGTLRTDALVVRGARERWRGVRAVQRTCRTFDAGLWISRRRGRVAFCVVGVALDFVRGEGADERSRLVLCGDALRDVRAIDRASCERSPWQRRKVTDRARLTDRRYPTGEPEGSPARSAAETRGCATRRLRRSRGVRNGYRGLSNPLSRLSDEPESRRKAGTCARECRDGHRETAVGSALSRESKGSRRRRNCGWLRVVNRLCRLLRGAHSPSTAPMLSRSKRRDVVPTSGCQGIQRVAFGCSSSRHLHHEHIAHDLGCAQNQVRFRSLQDTHNCGMQQGRNRVA